MAKKLYKNNSSGVCGVHYQAREGLWIARIKRNCVLKYLGAFSEKEDAVLARQQAEQQSAAATV